MSKILAVGHIDKLRERLRFIDAIFEKNIKKRQVIYLW